MSSHPSDQPDQPTHSHHHQPSSTHQNHSSRNYHHHQRAIDSRRRNHPTRSSHHHPSPSNSTGARSHPVHQPSPYQLQTPSLHQSQSYQQSQTINRHHQPDRKHKNRYHHHSNHPNHHQSNRFQPNHQPSTHHHTHHHPSNPPRQSTSTQPPSIQDHLNSDDPNQITPTTTHHPRRVKFGSKLTDHDQQPSSNHQSIEPNLPTNLDINSLSLSARLILELSTSSYDCSICISPIRPNQSIYHCPNCFAVFHLNCSTKWASRSVTDTSTKAAILRDRDRIQPSEDALKGEWRCPGCQHPHIGHQSIPKQYSCWCGKLKNPNRNHNPQAIQRSKIPHGCGQRCAKVSADGCIHGCMEECHPGSCPPCPAVIKTNCHCQKRQLSVRCSQLYPNRTNLGPIDSELLSCGQVCQRTLKCSLHSCPQICHSGDCQDCQVVRTKSCYCQRIVLTDQTCSDPIDHHSIPGSNRDSSIEKLTCVSKDGSQWLAEFSCQKPCPWNYDCGIHPCQSDCHPHLTSTPATCPFSPQALKTCPCGSTPLNSRQTCSDPIPTCQNRCGKSIKRCGHVCTKTCHLGECGSCQALVTTVCRCGKDRIVRTCAEVEQLKKDALIENELKPESERKDVETVENEAIEYRCERVCRVLRRCGKHTCNRRCCPLSFLESVLQTGSKGKRSKQSTSHTNSQQHEDQDPLGLHRCDLKCNKKLSCGLHHCQLLDHKGPCPTCLLASFDELSCHCGSTVIQSPVPCGTKINCQAPCQRPNPSCGHPKPPHTCHEEPDCPPCIYLTEKVCQCDKKNLVKNIRCSQPKVSCGQTCANLLTCGAHRCTRKCHLPGQCEVVCGQECSKPLKHCGHNCPRKCHAPSTCPTEHPCEALIDLNCECRHITQKIKCSSCDEKPEGNRDRVINCNNDCILIQRNSALARAFHINKSSLTSNEAQSGVEWSDRLMEFFDTHTLFAKAIEKQLEEFLKPKLINNHKSTSSKNNMIISTFGELKLAFLLELVTYYKIKAETLSEESRFNVKLFKDSNSCLPVPLLSDVCTNPSRNSLNPSKSSWTQDQLSSGNRLLTSLHGLSEAFPKNHRPNQSIKPLPSRYSILFEGVFGHDDQSLMTLIKSILNLSTTNQSTTQFALKWIGDEDVMLQLRGTSLMNLSVDVEFKRLKSIVKRLVSHFDQSDYQPKKFYQSIVLAKVDITTDDQNHEPKDKELIKRIEKLSLDFNELNQDDDDEDNNYYQDANSWKSSSTKLNPSQSFAKLSHPRDIQTNRFSSLSGIDNRQSNHSHRLDNPSSSTSAWNPIKSNKLNSSTQFGDVISGGFNKPPIAVLAPMASTSNSYGTDNGFFERVNHSNNSRKKKNSYLNLDQKKKNNVNEVDDLDVIDDWENDI